MIDSTSLLIEIGTEDLPAKQINTLIKNFKIEFYTACVNHELPIPLDQFESFATPRRLAIRIKKMPVHNSPKSILKKGPHLDAAFTTVDSIKTPTRATLGFAKSCGVDWSELTEHNQFLTYTIQPLAQKTTDLLVPLIEWALEKTCPARTMRWGAHIEKFVRPIRWVLVLWDNQPLSLSFKKFPSLQTSAHTYGHRFLSSQALLISNSLEYETILQNHFVLADPVTRQQALLAQCKQAAHAQNSHFILPDDLLTELTGLVEYPNILVGHFDPKFLMLPKEALMASMIGHQKCIPLTEPDHETLKPCFLITSNLNTKNPEAIIQGNERVMHARLSDCEFFYRSDQNNKLSSRQAQLNTIQFQAQLGSLGDQSIRLGNLCQILAERPEFNKTVNPQDAQIAGQLAKTDLTTDLVREFPELQGIMGYYYSQLESYPKSISIALREQYLPNSPTDPVGDTPLGQILAIATRLDYLYGYFVTNHQPTGDKDPFGLKRAAQGLVRLILNNNLDLKLSELFALAQTQYRLQNSDSKIFKTIPESLITCCLERYRSLYQAQFSPQLFQAVFEIESDYLLQIHQRLNAVSQFIQTDSGPGLIAANKRIANILAQAPMMPAVTIQSKLLETESEKKLYQILDNLKHLPLKFPGDYLAQLQPLSELKTPLELFFTDTRVLNPENSELTQNRLALLAQLYGLFIYIADFSKL